jgi:glycosyltransferase involved in cell wall biosynthesis
MSERWYVHLAGSQKIAWALDEDLHWVRRSLDGACRWTSLPGARIIHAAWPAALAVLPPAVLRGKTVICQADNPPSFYLGTDGFGELSRRADLWLARSSEAEEQFRLLGLPVRRVPYCIDPAIFHPLPDRADLREALGLSKDAFVIGNFHRDSEGRDLTKPKRQKGPDIFLEIARGLHSKWPQTVVLLAGPRRHWLLAELRRAGVPVVFAGTEPGATDDYARNILPRARLNELYQVLDVCVISSRWEGGPYSVLEALAAGCPVISTPVGTSRDVLPDECLFNSVERAVDLLESAADGGGLAAVCSAAASAAASSHGPSAVAEALATVYAGLPTGAPRTRDLLRSATSLLIGRFGVRFPRDLPQATLVGAECAEPLESFDSRRCRSGEKLKELAACIRRSRSMAGGRPRLPA